MKKILAISRNVLLLLFRGGTGLGLIVLIAAVAVFIFIFTKSDGVLINELRIRIRYSFFFFSGVLYFALLYLACVSLRKDIEQRQFHTISSAPVHRAQIWAGKYFGILALGFIVFVCGSLSTALCSGIMITKWGNKAEVKELGEVFFRTFFLCSPQMPSVDAEVEKRFKKMQIEGTLPTDIQEWQIRKNLRDEIQKMEQLVEPDGSRIWTFNWNSQIALESGKFVILKFKFYSERKREKISGHWTLKSSDSSNEWSTDFSGFPYMFHQIKIPVENIPKSSMVKLVFKGNDTPYLIFPMKNGVALLYDNGSIFLNYLRLLLISLLYMAIITALALAFASLFTYTVSVFVTLVTYLVGISSDFFISVLREISYGGHHGEQIAFSFFSWFINLGLWLTKGVKPPPAIDFFSDSMSIPLAEFFSNWGIRAVVYAAVFAGFGIYILTKKEIDKLINQ